MGTDAPETPGSSLGLEVGERISALDLLYALLLQSSNDAAVALADAVSGSTQAFVRLMNARAADLRLTDTHFASPNGLDDRGYSSAADLALAHILKGQYSTGYARLRDYLCRLVLLHVNRREPGAATPIRLRRVMLTSPTFSVPLRPVSASVDGTSSISRVTSTGTVLPAPRE